MALHSSTPVYHTNGSSNGFAHLLCGESIVTAAAEVAAAGVAAEKASWAAFAAVLL